MSSGAAFFISYSRGDAASRKLAAALSYNLPRLGYQVFVDVVGLKAGEKWTERLEHHIDTCDVFVILVSEKALASEHVLRELERALERNEATERPLIVPIRTQFTRELEGDERVLDAFERLDWQSKTDTPHVIERIDESASHVMPKPDVPLPAPYRPRLRLRAPLKWIGAGAALLLIVLGAFASVQVRALANAKSDESARVAFERLRPLGAFLIGWWDPRRLAEAHFTRRADAIDAVATPLLASRMREEADRGLVLATLAAFKRGGALSDAARDYAQKQNYALLDATLRGDEPSPGTALAVWRGSQRLLVAEGTRVWSCRANECATTELPNLDAAAAAAFVSETRLYTVSVDRSASQWDLGTFANPIVSSIRAGDSADSVATDGGDTAIVLGVPSRVTVALANGRRISAPDSLLTATHVTFGPCRDCLTLMFFDERAVIWNYDSGVWSLTRGAEDAAATRTGFLAVALRDGTIRFYDRNGNPIARPVPLRFESIEQLTISPDGQRAAVVHDDMVSVVNVDGTMLQLIPAGRTPAPIATAWAGHLLVTRTPSEVRVWNLARSVRDVAPGNDWRELRKKLGVTVDAGDNELGWNRDRGRIESQD